MEELDSELDNFLAEIDDIELSKMEEMPEEPDLLVWKECLDDTTKHPYYWHTVTQEVTWVKPECYDSDLKSQETALKEWRSRCEEVKKVNEDRKRAVEERKKLAATQPEPAVPRKNPRIELESETNGKKAIDVNDGSVGKIGKFNFLKSEEERKASPPVKGSARLTFTVKKAPTPEEEQPSSPTPPASPPALASKRPKITVPTHTASGKQRTVTEIAAEIKRKKQQIALTNARIHLQKRVEEQKLCKKPLVIPPKQEKPFQDDSKIENKTESMTRVRVKPPPVKAKAPPKPKSTESLVASRESKKKRIFQETKTKVPVNEVDKDAKRAIEKEASLLKEKLEFWGGDLKSLSKFQIQIIQLGTRISDFIYGHLSEAYIQSKISEMGQMLREHEENSVPKDWTCIYDREEKKYRYTNKNTGKSQFTHPGEDDEKSSSDSDSDKDDDLYEMFQQEIKEIETKVKKRESPPVEKTKRSTPPIPSPPCPPLPPCDAPPPAPPPEPVHIQPPQFYPERQGWGQLATPSGGTTPWGIMPTFPGMPAAPPPPPPDDGMMEAYSPGNSDTEEEPRPKKDLGVVSVKAPMRYDTPPASAMPVSAPSGITPPPTAASMQDEAVEQSAQGGEDDVSNAGPERGGSAPPSRPLRKKKKGEALLMGSSANKKQKKMNNLVAKWNKVNKHADTALK